MHAGNSQKRRKLIVLLVVGALYSFSIAYFFQSLPTARFTSDFFPRWYASRMLLTSDRSIYDGANSIEISQITGWPLLHYLGYYYPAYLLIFTAPLAVLSYETAHIIWTIIGLWCLWGGVMILARLLRPRISINRLTLLLVLITISVPVFQHTLYAQFNTLGVFALALTYRALYRQKYFEAGLWAGGLLFKPQAVLLPLLVFLGWTLFAPRRRRFWPGLALISVGLWGVAEWLEPNWVMSFLKSLENYQAISSVADKIWNPSQIVTGLVISLTLWLTVRLRRVEANETEFGGLLVWAISANALIVPMFGMMHMVLMGLIFIILLAGFKQRYPSLAAAVWFGSVGLLLAGLLSFIIPIIFVGPTGWQITVTEWVYRLTMPVVFGLASLALLFKPPAWLKISRPRAVG